MAETLSSAADSTPSRRHHVRFLASVRSSDEAHVAVQSGADVIDCKDPSKGALGALSLNIVREIRAAIPRHMCLSATAGDLVPEPATVVAAVEDMASTGVDYVKIGFFPGGDAKATIRALGSRTFGSASLVGLLLADRNPDFELVQTMAEAGFSGVMIDTADKASGSLTDVISHERLSFFLSEARHYGLFAGLAGALRLAHIPGLLCLRPGVLGFRGALCKLSERAGELDGDAVAAVRRAIPTGYVRGEELLGQAAHEAVV